MWIVNAFIVHVLLLGSIFVIYFRSPVLTGLKPQIPLTKLGLRPPAKRLVLFSTDGLRAESFFRNNLNDVPHLRNLFKRQGGLIGISHTRVPTESRPGHIALIAGLYEDPSAVTRGWKENPIDFDSIFNRSRKTFAWGADDILHIFSRMESDTVEQRLYFDAYDHDLDFSGRNDTTALDNWVFDRVILLLKRKKEQLQNEEQLIFFLHLLGLDSAGHIHKPGSKRFLENLHSTERRIVEIYTHFEEAFPDGQTAYVLTADHGMTDAGSHGAGAAYETETPFFLWGAGIANEAPWNGKTFEVSANKKLPLYELEQAQLTPLMSALIGIAPPMNNFGSLPIGFLNVSGAYEAGAAYTTALQLLEQFCNLYETHKQGTLSSFLNYYSALDSIIIQDFKLEFEHLNSTAEFDEAIKLCQHIMQHALEGIDYYHGYYRNVLLFCTAAIFLGWMYYLLQLLVERNDCPGYKHTRMSTPILFFIATIVLIYVHLQQVPLATSVYFLIPIFVWMAALEQRFTPFSLWSQYSHHKFQLLSLVLCAEILVATFFQREVISLAFLLFAIVKNWKVFSQRDFSFLIWICLLFALLVFPVFPPSVGYKNNVLLVLGMILALLRPFCVKARFGYKYIIISTIGLLNALFCIYCNTQHIELSKFSQSISWFFLIYNFAVLIQNRCQSLKARMELIFFNLTSFYTMLCTSYEAIFIIMLASELLISFSAHEYSNAPNAQPPVPNNSTKHVQNSFRIAFAILLYTFFSFLGTGNIISVSSYDPNIVRCFLTTFQPFIIMGLIILKLIIPVILNISIIYAVSDFARQNERQIFICLLLICDIMGLNFLFLVRNKGSWLDIGTSISHFVVMEATTLVLLLLTLPAKLFLKLYKITPMSLKLK